MDLKLCGDFILKPNWTMEWRTLNEHELIYFPYGTASVYWSGSNTSHILDKPCFVLTLPGQIHRYEFKAEHPIRHMFAHFTVQDPGLVSMLQDMPPVISYGVFMSQGLFKNILYLSANRPPYWRERANALLYAAILELLGASQGKYPATPLSDIPVQIVHAIKYIKTHLNEPISVRKLAEIVGWRHEYFTRKFIEHTGLSPKQMILQRRIDQASELLMFETLSIKEVAAMIGFQNEHYFSRMFAKLKGMPATEFRKKYSASDLVRINLVPADDLHEPYGVNKYYYSDLPSASRIYFPPDMTLRQNQPD